MEYIIDLLLRILFTAVAYMLFPIIRLLLHKGKFDQNRAKKIALWNSIVIGFVFCILTIESSEEGAIWNAGPAVIYYWINRSLLTNRTSHNSPNNPSSTTTNKNACYKSTKSTDYRLSSVNDKKTTPATPSPKNANRVGNYEIIATELAKDFTENARKIIQQIIEKVMAENNLVRKTDLMKVILGYVSQEFANAKGPKTDLIVCAYYQIAFDEIITLCGDMNDLIFNYAISQMSGTISKDIHKYSQMLVRIQLIIDDAITACKSHNSFHGYLKQLKAQVFNELNSYIDDATDWNKLSQKEESRIES